MPGKNRPQRTADSIARTGMIEAGNISLSNRKPVPYEGGYATVRSMSFNDHNGVEVLIPTVVNGTVVSDNTAIGHYYLTGQHLGKYTSPQAADVAAQRIHLAEAARIKRMGYGN